MTEQEPAQKMGLLMFSELSPPMQDAIEAIVDEDSQLIAARVMDRLTNQPVVVLLMVLREGATTAVCAPIAVMVDPLDPSWGERLEPTPDVLVVPSELLFTDPPTG